MKAIYKTILILIFFSVPSIASACYEGDFESSGKGHRLEIVLNREPVLLTSAFFLLNQPIHK